MDTINTAATDNPLIGTWEMLDWYNQDETGQKHYPLGQNATGYISYSSDGHVFVHLMAADRQLYHINDPFGGSEAEDSAAMKSQISYAGRYRVSGDQVTHHVTHASCPNWVGTDQIRDIRFDGPQMTLSAAGAVFQGERVTAYVIWKRAE
ncbi:lipocalin-like domain-containing protein [Ruegeria meonggei]|uniref:Lipocalin-like domain-containing protein n=1 Tax=Ruegeria meonggei TaxID=1446476 RepID=A0A1X6YVQ9_9RHOB|nr:lipocalin-like domain-containing protein [Ruegeria meonggei]SLN33029.1 hypothetical protein RUM8411_01398 [Ruegeria meonggei]